MRFNIGMLRKYTREFGIFKGISILARTKLGGADNMKIPNVKHRISLRPNTTDNSIFYQIFVLKEYNFELGVEPKVIIDGGANIGLASTYFKNRFPNAKVICVEPDEENIAILTRNVSKYDGVFIKHAAIWPVKTYTKPVDKYNIGKSTLVVEEVLDLDSISDKNITQTLTIDAIMEEFKLDRIDLLKLDIETAEKKLFEGDYSKWLPKTKTIVIELHDRMLEGCSQAFFNAVKNSFTKYTVSESGENIVVVNEDII